MYTDYIGVVYGSRSVYLAYMGVQLYFYVRIHTACTTGLLAKIFTDCIYPPEHLYVSVWVRCSLHCQKDVLAVAEHLTFDANMGTYGAYSIYCSKDVYWVYISF